MSVLVQKVSTGDTIVFDKESRDLFIFDEKSAGEIEGREGADALKVARDWSREERVRHFDRADLSRLQAALAGVVLLV